MSGYRPASEQEVFDIMNVLDDRLLHSNSAVVMACAGVTLRAYQTGREKSGFGGRPATRKAARVLIDEIGIVLLDAVAVIRQVELSRQRDARERGDHQLGERSNCRWHRCWH